MVLPVLEATSATVLLDITILVSTEGPLLKFSVIAFFVHGLDGGSEGDIRFKGLERPSSLEEMTEGKVASLKENNQGRPKPVGI